MLARCGAGDRRRGADIDEGLFGVDDEVDEDLCYLLRVRPAGEGSSRAIDFGINAEAGPFAAAEFGDMADEFGDIERRALGDVWAGDREEVVDDIAGTSGFAMNDLYSLTVVKY